MPRLVAQLELWEGWRAGARGNSAPTNRASDYLSPETSCRNLTAK